MPEEIQNLTDLVDALATLDEPAVTTWLKARAGFYRQFKPRPDKPEQFDEQTGFIESKAPVSVLIGGNAAGTTEAAACKTARFLLHEQAPPRKDTPFWVIAETYDQCVDTCWKEKLNGNGHIPDCEVDWDRVAYLDRKLNRPSVVPLRPWPDAPDKNWCIEFKSYAQGRRAMQARSIGGFWFSEQFPMDVFLEVLRGCRDTMYPGAQFAEFTPIDPALSVAFEPLIENPPPGWEFFRANTELNVVNLAGGWFEQFLAALPEEVRASRTTGHLAGFEGQIYPTFNRKVHCIQLSDLPINRRSGIVGPPGVYHFRGVDWGAGEEHPFVCLWAYRDNQGRWFFYDEYFSTDQARLTRNHMEEIHSRWAWPEDDWHGETFADPSRPDLLNDFNIGFPEMDIDPINTVPASNEVFKGIDSFRGKLKGDVDGSGPHLFICADRCPNFVRQLRRYRWAKRRVVRGAALLNAKAAPPVPHKKDDDTCDAGRYVVHTVEKRYGMTLDQRRYSGGLEGRGSVRLRRQIESIMRPGIHLERTR